MCVIAFLSLFTLIHFTASQCPGVCQNANVLNCDSGYQSGLCPGPSNFQCCPQQTPSCMPPANQCQDNSLPCNGNYQSGLCPGGDNIQCCVGGGGNPTVAPPPGGGDCSQFANAQWNCADVSCDRTVCTGCGQPNYECAEFVARSLASAGLIPLSPYASQGSYGSFNANGKNYDLLWVSSKNGGIRGLEDYLSDSGWNSCQSDSCVTDCSALMVVGSEGAYSHTVVGIANQVCDAHNVARYQVPPSFYHINMVWNAPGNIAEIVARQRAEREQNMNITTKNVKDYSKPNHKLI